MKVHVRMGNYRYRKVGERNGTIFDFVYAVYWHYIRCFDGIFLKK